MISGLLVDCSVLAVVIAFGWAGMQLGGIASLGRLFASLLAFGVAALLRDPIGAVIKALIGSSADFARLLGMLIVGFGVYLAGASLFRWWQSRMDAPSDAEEPDAAAPRRAWLAGPRVGAGLGGLLGIAWSVLFLTVLVLAPMDNVLTRSALRSQAAGQLIEHGALMRWFVDGFPHYTQTLPKGSLGVVVGERSSLPMHGTDTPHARPSDAEPLLRTVNRLRGSERVQAMTFNPRVAGVAERHALALASERTLSHEPIGGGAMQARVRAALGESASSFRDDVEVLVAWSHTPSHAGRGLVEDARAESLLTDPSLSEIGIGIADAGWFDGRVYVLLLVGPPPGAADGGGAGAAAAAGLDAEG